MESWSLGARWAAGTKLAAGLGIWAGLLELIVILARAALEWTAGGVIALGLVAVLIGALTGALAGLLAGPVHTLGAERPAYRAIALQVGIAGGVLALVHLGPWAADLVRQGHLVAGLAIGSMPLGIAGMLTLNARYLLARVEVGKAPPASWLVVSGAAALVVVGVAAAVAPLRDVGGAYALDRDPSILVVTVDGLRAMGHAETHAATEGGTWFRQAVTPSTSSVAAHGALWTGLHPLRHRAIDDRRALSTGWTTVPERFAAEGFATAAFVSTARVTGVGLEQGFGVFDDAFEPVPGLSRLSVTRLLAAGRWVRRSTADTFAAAAAYLASHGDVPSLVWVHLDLLDADVDAYEVRVAEVFAGLERLRALTGEGERAGRTMVVLLGAHGRHLDGARPRVGLEDALVHVPLWMHVPEVSAAPDVTAQVRLMDLAPTLLSHAALERADEVEGLELFGFLDGRRTTGAWSTLIGRTADSTPLIGLRQGDVKVVVDPVVDDEELFDLAADPGETRDLSVEQPAALDKARALLAPDLRALQALAESPTLGPHRDAVLDALGTD